ncbi:SO_0444 family Cu/Zn efflux transporter [Sulfurimonas sp.]|uniref:SO_0444 family Cu/Zn efflux transporter n=1 Tax=Sulfurimonas sp. TaxID=2022749 RepID=UPI002B491F9A|nr:SO_0444 family Cu/Zn efflux transporter [Sulfurimonas sp.]
MEYIIEFFTALYDLSNAMAIYILLGLVFAGILHEIVPDSIVTKHLGKESILSVIKATVFGIPLPVCSCGVIPIASSIKKSGASKGATLSFLISTPITGVDSILATYGIFGWIFTIYRIFTSMVIAMVAGILTNYLDKEVVAEEKHQSYRSCCCSTPSSASKEKQKKFSLMGAIKYAFVTLLCGISKALLFGLLVGALITIAIPENLSDILVEYYWLSYLIAISIAVPMYVCATASLPIAAALMLNGVSPGAAFVFLSAGPATNTVTIGVVKKMLGTTSLYIYLGSIILGSVLFGLGLDFIFDSNSIDTKSLIHMSEEVAFFEILSSIVLWSFMIYFTLKSYFKKS